MKYIKYKLVTWNKLLIFISLICIETISFAGSNIKISEEHKEKSVQFIENKGQWIKNIKYKAMLNGGAVFLTDEGFVYDYYNQAEFSEIAHLRHEGGSIKDKKLLHHAFKVKFMNANSDIKCTSSEKFSFYNNYFIGSDPSKWAGKVGIYGQVYMSNVYDGIDLSVYGKGIDLKYDFRVRPGADPEIIQLAYEGVQPVLTKEGHLLIKTSVNEIRELAPYTFQWVNGKQKRVASKYYIKGNIVSFQITGDYDRSQTLIIDPQLKYSTYSGATGGAYSCMSTTYDAAGSLYVSTDATQPTKWPTTIGAYQTTAPANVQLCNAINKYSSDGNVLIYSTYIGGAGVSMNTNSMATTNQNELIITGAVTGANFPVTAGAYDNTYNGNGDLFVTKFSVDGSSLLQSTFVGGNDLEAGLVNIFAVIAYEPQMGPSIGANVINTVDIQIDNAGNIWVASATASADFPTTPNGFQPTFQGGDADGVVFCLNSTLSALLYSSFYGGTGTDVLEGLTIMPNGSIAVCGITNSNALITTPNALYPVAVGGFCDGYVGIINSVTGTLVASTYLGTNDVDYVCKIQANSDNEIYVLGKSMGNYPVSAGVYNIPDGILFIQKLNSILTTSLASTHTGFSGNDGCIPTAFLVDVCGTVYLSCVGPFGRPTLPALMPTTPNALISTQRNYWCAALNGELNNLIYATYFGSVNTAGSIDHQHQGTAHFDPKGILYQSICAKVDNNPGVQGSWSPQKQNGNGNSDAFSFKIDFQLSGAYADFSIDPATNNGNDTGCSPLQLTFANNSTIIADYFWDFGDGSPVSNATSPTHIFQAGDYYVKLIVVLNDPNIPQGCKLRDTAILHIVALPGNKPLITLNDTFLCNNNPISITANMSNTTAQTTYRWEPSAAILSSNINSPTATVDPAISTDILLIVSNGPGQCDSASETMHITLSGVANANISPEDTFICPGDTIVLTASGGNSYIWNANYNILANNNIATVWPTHNIVYSVLVRDADNCENIAYSSVSMYENFEVDAGRDIDIKYGEPIRLNGQAPNDFFWHPDVYPSTILNPEVRPLKTTTYYLTGRTSSGCIATDSVTVHVAFSNLPNAFSPNGDGLNDVFKLYPNIDHVKLVNFSVFDRWGKRIFYTEDIKEGWDGTYNNKSADLGVYYYYISYAIGYENYIFKGDISLIR